MDRKEKYYNNSIVWRYDTYMHSKQPNSDLEFEEKNIQKLSVTVWHDGVTHMNYKLFLKSLNFFGI